MQGPDFSVSTLQSPSLVNKTALVRVAAQLAVVAGLVVLAALNIRVKGWTEMEDGVLWVGNGSDVVASVVADDSPASRAGIKPGDVLLRIDQKLVQLPTTWSSHCTPPPRAPGSNTSSRGSGDSELLIIPVAGIPSGTHWLYLVLAERRSVHVVRRVRVCGSAGRRTRPRCISSGCRSRFSAC